LGSHLTIRTLKPYSARQAWRAEGRFTSMLAELVILKFFMGNRVKADLPTSGVALSVLT
jgi:hypothetical protein